MRQPSENDTGTLRKLWGEFLPLSVSDVAMACGDPMILTTVAHLPEARLNMAAVGTAKSLAVFFESPIIMLLHASNALAGSKASRATLWKFTLIVCAVLTAGLCVLAMPPVFEPLASLLWNADAQFAERSRLLLTFLLLWPACIGWRRYFQGILIHSGQGSKIARAGIARLGLIAIVLLAGWWTETPGHLLAGFALAAGILLEALVVTISVRQSQRAADAPARSPAPAPVISSRPTGPSGGLLGPGDARRSLPATGHEKLPSHAATPTTLREIGRYYWPLANSMLLVWGGRALLIALIAHAVDSATALAAWPAAWGIAVLISNATRMVQQVIIRNGQKVSEGRLLKFAGSVGLVFSLVLLSLTATSPGRGFLAFFVGSDAALLAVVQAALWPCVVAPFLVAMQNALQGFLIVDGQTRAINLATWLSTMTLLSVCSLAIASDMQGARAAALATLVALVLETLLLARSFLARRAGRPTLATLEQAGGVK